MTQGRFNGSLVTQKDIEEKRQRETGGGNNITTVGSTRGDYSRLRCGTSHTSQLLIVVRRSEGRVYSGGETMESKVRY
jgi:hypothetical protein